MPGCEGVTIHIQGILSGEHTIILFDIPKLRSVKKVLLSIRSSTHLVLIAPLVPLQYPSSTPLVPLQYPSSTSVVPLQYPSSIPLVPLQYPSSTPLVPLQYPSSTPLVPKLKSVKKLLLSIRSRALNTSNPCFLA